MCDLAFGKLSFVSKQMPSETDEKQTNKNSGKHA